MEEVQNFTELRALDPNKASKVLVLGYAAAYDGGGGIFRKENQTEPATLVDNDGNTIESDHDPNIFWRLVE